MHVGPKQICAWAHPTHATAATTARCYALHFRRVGELQRCQHPRADLLEPEEGP